MPVKLLNKLSGWVRLWLIFTISWGGWFLYQGITSANELQEARHYLDEGLKDYIKREQVRCAKCTRQWRVIKMSTVGINHENMVRRTKCLLLSLEK